MGSGGVSAVHKGQGRPGRVGVGHMLLAVGVGPAGWRALLAFNGGRNCQTTTLCSSDRFESRP